MSVNTTIATAILLIVLGVGGVFSTGAITATIPALFGIVLLGLGVAIECSGNPRLFERLAALVALLGVLAPIGNLVRIIGQNGLIINAAVFANLTLLGICGLFLVVWLWEQISGERIKIK
jgi:threonine dehydrogenase-like Zn-dependent dehydrogenase